MHSKLLSVLIFFLVFAVSSFAQTTYYSKSAGNLNSLSSWGANTDGTGIAPSSFTSAGVTYVISNSTLATISAAWTVSGAGSMVQVGNGSGATEFSIPGAFAFTGSLSVANNGTLTILNTSIPNISTLAVGSTVNYARVGGQNVTPLSYYNLYVTGSGQKSMTNVANASISNSLVIAAGNMLRLTNSNTLTTTISGSLSGAGTIIGDVGTNLIINGSGNFGSLTFSTTLNLNQLTINRTGGTVALGSNLTLGSNFTHNAGNVSLGAFLLTLNGAITFPASAANGDFIGAASASLAIGASTTAITNAVIFNQSALANRSLSRFTLNRAAQTLSLATSVDVLNAYTQTNGNVFISSNALSIAGVLSFPTTTANGYFIGSTTSSLSIIGAGAITNTLKFDQSSGAGCSLSYFQLDHTIGQLSLGNNLNCSGSFIHSTGTLAIGATSLTLSGVITLPSSISNASITGSGTSSLCINGSGAITGSLVMNQSSASARTLNSFILNRSTETLVLANNLIVNSTHHTAGAINLNGRLLTINGPATFPTSAASGVIIGSGTSSLSIGGTGAITNSLQIAQTSTSTKSLYDLLLSRTGQTLSIGNALEIRNSIQPTAGTIITNSVVTLKSDATRSAMLGVVSGSFSGPITVESYAPGGFTGWTNIGPSGVSGLSLSNWENQFFMTCNGCPNNEFSAGGYFVSALSFSETLAGAAAYVPLTYNSSLTAGQGYWVYLGTGSSTSSAITYTAQGPAVTGNVAIPLSRSANTGYNLLANPYASPIDWDLVVADVSNTNVNGSVYFYNPDIGQTISYVTGVSSPAGYIANGIIPMGQGFYVQANVTTTITFRELHKSTANTNSNPLLRPAPMSSDSVGTVFRLSLMGEKLDYDETAFRFHPQASNNYDRLYDAYKQFETPGYIGTGPVYDHYTSISSKANNEDLSINSLPNTNTADIVIPLLVKTMFSGNYTISPIDIDNFVPNTCVLLKDKVTGFEHDLRNGPYNFTIADTTSAPRFELRLCVGAVPLSAQALTANKSNVKMLQTKMNTVLVSASFANPMKSSVTAYNTIGQIIIAEQQLQGTEDSLELNFENYKGQVVMVKVSNEQGHIVKKFIIY
eukprot:gene4007-5734_t